MEERARNAGNLSLSRKADPGAAYAGTALELPPQLQSSSNRPPARDRGRLSSPTPRRLQRRAPSAAQGSGPLGGRVVGPVLREPASPARHAPPVTGEPRRLSNGRVDFKERRL